MKFLKPIVAQAAELVASTPLAPGVAAVSGHPGVGCLCVWRLMLALFLLLHCTGQEGTGCCDCHQAA